MAVGIHVGVEQRRDRTPVFSRQLRIPAIPITIPISCRSEFLSGRSNPSERSDAGFSIFTEVIGKVKRKR